ncbi:Uncharacterized protein TCM_030652 [Theobroma cacao]|uniref:Uncharacterized protein n=1 Tax=Theobroma cacao TaxID=3641 RepID=A0A061F557_THECC|nr:Uncharacterized protein TCM_030652 [Theobroma cacao]
MQLCFPPSLSNLKLLEVRLVQSLHLVSVYAADFMWLQLFCCLDITMAPFLLLVHNEVDAIPSSLSG